MESESRFLHLADEFVRHADRIHSKIQTFGNFPQLSTRKYVPPQFSHKLTLVFCCGPQHIAAEYRKCMRVMSNAAR
jgi:hypothetical protein